MIITLTMNPSIDISYPLDTFHLDQVNRVKNVRKTPGGKGLNVTRVLQQVGDDVIASGLLGGHLGEEIKEELTKANISHSFSKIQGQTRNCIAILHEGKQTEILESGPVVSSSEAAQFLAEFSTLLEKGDIVVISGSLPEELETDFYTKILDICHKKNKKVILDCSGETLKTSISALHKPFLIKPNINELSDLLGKKLISDPATLKKELNNPLFTGIEWIVVSLGSHGAFAKHQNKFYKVDIPKISVVNPVGSGDSTIAGLASGIFHNETDENILKKANVLGMLNAQEVLTGHVNMNNYQELFDQLIIKEI